jgi:hypothetical protein
VDLGLQVSAPIWLAEMGHALPAQSEHPAVLSTGRNLERQTLASGCGNVDLTAQ